MADNSNRIVLDTYTEEKQVSLKVVNREVHANNFTLTSFGDLYLGSKLVVDYKDMCESYPALKVGDCIPSLYVIRFAVNKDKGIDYARFVCGFDLLSDGRIWCGHLKTEYGCSKPLESSECFFADMDKAVAHIDKILGVNNWNFFMEEVGV